MFWEPCKIPRGRDGRIDRGGGLRPSLGGLSMLKTRVGYYPFGYQDY